MTDRKTMTMKAAADLLGVHVNTVRNWIDAGQLEARVLPSGFRRPYTDSVNRLIVQRPPTQSEVPNLREGTTWRYCFTREKTPDGEDFWTIREVYISRDGSLSWTEDAIAPRGDSWADVMDDLAIMGRAVGQDILDLTLDPPALVDPRPIQWPHRQKNG